MTEPPAHAGPGTFVGMALVVGVFLTVLNANIDLICLPDFVSTPGAGKLQGIFNTFAMAFDHPKLFFPLLVGFSLLGAAVSFFPLLFTPASAGRTIAMLGIIILLFGGVGYGVYFLPRAGCDGTWQGLRVLLQIGTGVIVWFIVLLLCFRKDRRAS